MVGTSIDKHRCYKVVAYSSALLLSLILAGCGTSPKISSTPSAPVKSGSSASRGVPALPPAGSGRGGYYKDDGPGDAIPEGLLDTPDAVPVIEPYSRTGNKPYVVFGKTYTPLTDDQPFKQRGVGSWYGKKFHKQKTSSGELYDMYKMTAAHPTLPIPSYARVTNLKTGAQVIVRVNDRGPFHSSRIIDLSYTAALKLGYLGSGSGQLEVERLLPADIVALNQQRGSTPAPAQVPVSAPASAEPLRDNTASAVVTTEAVDVPVLTAQPLLVSQSAPTPAPGATAATDNNNQLAAGFYLQFGAYAQAANADAARSRLMLELSGLVTSLDSIAVNGLYRLYAGPYTSRADADSILQQIRQRSRATPIIVQR
ncbi:septal ring lytic transglycosylase RlpA family protein [Collimonas sp.]|jgi:rare lipoprotein A|uniref:septal ring lytic transglycosylase RlpA family protein n=1 Tax=Collimonas sp. TaxID=1963772 RepID=UPI002CE092D9|nr:septal ring lytic transglycosylase RlpA family protein [Collimonas sp.]HWW06525.1 septal ring lytic transglycosylase RlpA family protein [Collimonas sp.]